MEGNERARGCERDEMNPRLHAKLLHCSQAKDDQPAPSEPQMILGCAQGSDFARSL